MSEVQQAAERWRANKYPEGGKIADAFLLADAKTAEVDSHDALLAACKAAKKELNCLIDQATHRGYSSGGPKRIVEQLTTAIAAAEGTDR